MASGTFSQSVKAFAILLLGILGIWFIASFFTHSNFWFETTLRVLMSLVFIVFTVMYFVFEIMTEPIIRPPVKKRFLTILWFVAFLAICGFSLGITLPRLMDIPYMLTSDYSSVTGTATNIIELRSGKGVTVKGIHFTIRPNDLGEITTATYKVTYLPHSKYVVKIEEVSKAEQ